MSSILHKLFFRRVDSTNCQFTYFVLKAVNSLINCCKNNYKLSLQNKRAKSILPLNNCYLVISNGTVYATSKHSAIAN